jgi:hypothetical protein
LCPTYFESAALLLHLAIAAQSSPAAVKLEIVSPLSARLACAQRINRFCVKTCRTILPTVQHLGLACRGLAVCSSCLPWGPRSLNLVFTAASNTTRERLDLTADLTSTFDANIQTTVWSARLPHDGTGASPCEFEEDLFDDHMDGSGASESSSSNE